MNCLFSFTHFLHLTGFVLSGLHVYIFTLLLSKNKKKGRICVRKHHLKKISWSCTCWNCWALNPICGQRNALGSARLAIVSTAATTIYVLLLALVIFLCSLHVSEAGLDKNTSGWTRASHSNLDNGALVRVVGVKKTAKKKLITRKNQRNGRMRACL